MYGVWVLRSPRSLWSCHPLVPLLRTLYARPFTSYDSSRGTEPRQGETVPVDMFIISTSKPLLRFSGLDVGPPLPPLPLPLPPCPTRRSARRYKPIRSEGRKGPTNKLRGTRPTARTFSLSPGTKAVSRRAITVLLYDRELLENLCNRVGDVGLRKLTKGKHGSSHFYFLEGRGS